MDELKVLLWTYVEYAIGWTKGVGYSIVSMNDENKECAYNYGD